MSRAQDVDEPFSQRAAAQVLQAKRLSDRWNHEGRVLLAVRGRTELVPSRRRQVDSDWVFDVSRVVVE